MVPHFKLPPTRRLRHIYVIQSDKDMGVMVFIEKYFINHLEKKYT